MALIVCKNCGKSISDKTEKCIHCGHPVADVDETPVVESTSEKEEAAKDDRPIFHHLPVTERKALEYAFLKTDPWALAYRRKKGEIEKFFYLNCWADAAVPISALCAVWADKNAPGGFWSVLSMISLVVVAIGWLGSLFMIAYSRFSNDSIKNIALYNKKLGHWLSKEKGIKYIPDLPSKKAKRIYNQIEIDDD